MSEIMAPSIGVVGIKRLLVRAAIRSHLGLLPENVIARKVGETDALYGSVTSADIAESLAAKGYDIERRKLHLPEPIKRVGEFEVPIKLHREVTVSIKVKVIAEGGPENAEKSKK